MSSASSDPPKDENPWTKDAQDAFGTKSPGKYYDPCQEAAERTFRCLTRNNGDREFCRDYFEAYRDCKKAWTEKWREEKRKKGWSLF